MNNRDSELIKEIMSEYLFNIINEYADAKYGSGIVNESDLYEICEDNVISSKKIATHRWYEIYENVMQINDTFIRFNTYNFTGDSGQYDMDLPYMTESFVEVIPKEVTTTIYVKKE